MLVPAKFMPPWRQPMGKWMVSLVNSHTNATRIGWHLWEIDLKICPWVASRVAEDGGVGGQLAGGAGLLVRRGRGGPVGGGGRHRGGEQPRAQTGRGLQPPNGPSHQVLFWLGSTRKVSIFRARRWTSPGKAAAARSSQERSSPEKKSASTLIGVVRLFGHQILKRENLY